MDDDAWSTVEQPLRKRRQDIAQAWYYAISLTADHHEDTSEVRAHLETLVDQAVKFLLDETQESTVAEAIGGALNTALILQPEAFGRLLEILAVEMVAGLPSDQAALMQPRLAKLLGGIATGHGRAAGDSTLSQQMAIHGALLSARESEALFRTLTETTELAIFMFRGEYNIYVNAAACDITGYTREELLGIPFWHLIRADYQALVRERGMARQRGEGVDTHYEVPIIAKNGKSRWLQFAGKLIDYQGAPAVLGMAIDVTARKLSEDALRESEQKFRTLAEVTPAGILITDRDGPFYANPGLEILTGYSLEELRHIDRTELVDHELLPQLRSFLDALDGEHPTQATEFKIHTKSGEAKWVTTSWRPIELCGERAWMNTTFDITPRVEIEEKLKTYAKRLELFGEIDRAGILARSKHEIASATLSLISELIGCDRASVTEVDTAHHSHTVLAVAPTGRQGLALGGLSVWSTGRLSWTI